MDRNRPAKGLSLSSIVAMVIIVSAMVMLLGLGVAADRAPRLNQERYGGDVSLLADEAFVSIDPVVATYHRGQTFDVQVVISDVVGLFGYQLNVNFDPSVVQVVDADPGFDGVQITVGDFLVPLVTTPNRADNTLGTIELAVSQGPQYASQDGNGVLATISFQAIAPGSAGVGLGSVLLSDKNALPISYTSQDSGITILDATPTDGPSPTPTATRTSTPTMTPTTGPSPTNTPDAGPTPYFYLVPNDQEVGIGGSTEVEVRTSHVDGVSGVQVYLSWDPAFLAVVDQDPGMAGVQITSGDLFDGYRTYAPMYSVDNAAGEMYYAHFMTEQFCISGDWSVFTLEFQSLREGTAAITFGQDTLMACAGLDLPTGWVDGQIQVITGSTSTPTATSEVTETPIPTATETPSPTETASPVPTIATVVPPEIVCNDIIENGDMENLSSTAWQFIGWADYATNQANSPSHSVWLCGLDNATDEMAQTVALPASPLTATLGCWWYVESPQFTDPGDYLYLEVREAGGATAYLSEVIASDGSTRNTWQYAELDLIGLPEGNVDVVLRGETDGTPGTYTSFFVDDVTLDVCVEQSNEPTPTPGAGLVHLPLVQKVQN